MSLAIPTNEPQKFTAGDTVQWTKSLSDYPATLYALAYQLRGPQEISVTASTYQTSDFLISWTAAQTAAFKPGLYSLVAFVTDLATSLTRYSIKPRFPLVTICENPANYVAGSAANLTFAARTLAAVEATIEKLASRAVSTASVNGQTYSLQDMGKLISLRQRCREEVQSEKDAISVAAGLGGKKNILVRFPYINSGTNAWSVPGVLGPWS
jgi:hypothetical protein